MSASTAIAWPLIVAPNGLARYSAILAISCWVTKHFRLVVATVRSVISFSDIDAALALALITALIRGPSTGPGRIALTRMASGPSSIDNDFVNPITPHFAAA